MIYDVFPQFKFINPKMLTIKKATVQDSETIASLAKLIWTKHFTPIIGKNQVDYMLKLFQSKTAIAKQMSQGIEYFLVNKNEQLAGYIAIQYQTNKLFISKFYLKSEFRGQGLAKPMLQHIEELAKQTQLYQLELTVNKLNSASQAYLKLGFNIESSIQIDIGDGFIMDDYLMIKHLTQD
ncbi:GNAT family N-acetyltransferase [Aliikangiella sp. IMCC44359]|uniref:GNAT family N-acetyltransferase n=1 Tax=Aliikangiella sp. IMCC44359 TaxID=3459125 RepID=UPI00403AB981